MRLWIDGQCLQTASRFRGIGRYVTELIRAIASHHPEVELLISFNAAMPEEALLARELVSGIIDSANIHVWHGAVRAGEAVEGYTPERHLSELAIAHHVNCLAPDVALSASPFEGVGDLAVPLLPDRGCDSPIAAIFYDAIPFRYKEIYLPHDLLRGYYHRRLDLFPRFADNLCISAFSRGELQSLYPGTKASNISAGISCDFIEIEKEEVRERFDLGRFILYVGALDWRKNVKAIVNAFSYIDQAWPQNDLKLVIAGDGPPELLRDVIEFWDTLKLERNRLVCLGHVSDEQLVSLYKQTKMLVQPSFMEGFGLTALEAIYCGAPVVAARAGALPEVVGAEQLLFDPTAPSELADLIVRLLRDTTGTAEICKMLQMHAAQFTWKRSATIAVERLAKLASGGSQIDIRSSRNKIAGMLEASGSDREIAARSLALSEPVPVPRRLLIDATSTVRIDHKTGIQRVVKKICAALAEIAPKASAERMFVACDDDRGWFEVDGRTLDKPQKHQQVPVFLSADILLMLDSSWEFHALYQKDWRACRLRGGEVIASLYDFVPLDMQAMCNPVVPPVFVEWFKAALTWSTGFVCISRAVADELLTLLEAIEFPRRMKIGYWQLGADFTSGSRSLEPMVEVEPRRSQFLMVGTLEPRKGHRVALDAFEILWAEGADAELTIVGRVGWGTAHLVERIRSHPEFGKRLIWREMADDAELSTLYAGCDALIAASFAEGFGLPIVEAGHYGKPVVASDIPVFREVSEGAADAHLFQVGDASALAGAVNKFLRMRREMTATRIRPEWPNWAESAAQLESVVLGQDWYQIYEPREKRPFGPLSDLGRTQMAGPLEMAERAHRLELIEGPHPSEDRRYLKIIVAVTNLSNTVWSSAAVQGGVCGGVALSYRLYDCEGAVIECENPRACIPFVHLPGRTLFLAVNVPSESKALGAIFADIELVQGSAAWFGSALRVGLETDCRKSYL